MQARVNIFLLAALLNLAGCKQSVDLDAIQRLAAATDAASSSYAALAQDLDRSCVRMYEWNWSSARSYYGFPTLEATCGADAKASAQWQQANQVVVAYVRALGNLAGGSDTETDYGLSGLVESINASGATSLSSEQQKAVSAAASDLIKDIFNIRRRNEIAAYAPKANEDLKALIVALQSIANTNYAEQLDLELVAINHFYSPVVAAVGTARPSSVQKTATKNVVLIPLAPQVTRSVEDMGKVEILTLRDRYRQDRAALDARRGAIGAYVRSLSSIASAHAALVDAIQRNDTSHVGGIIASYVSQLKPDLQTVSKAFAGEKP